MNKIIKIGLTVALLIVGTDYTFAKAKKEVDYPHMTHLIVCSPTRSTAYNAEIIREIRMRGYPMFSDLNVCILRVFETKPFMDENYINCACVSIDQYAHFRGFR